MKSKILEFLKTNEGYISGQELSDILGVSRTSIWKVINQLKAEGYGIESVSNKGYRLIDSPDILSKAEIQYDLKTTVLGKEIIVYNQVDSTNKQAKKLAIDGEKHGTVILAEEQLEGKGRRGRLWKSPPNKGIWLSIILRPDLHPSKASMLTLIAGLAVVHTINRYTKNQAFIKWPNDIIINEKKVSGTLTEMSSELDVINYVVVGIGVNVNTTDFDDEIKEIATSLANEEGKSFERALLVKGILESFEKFYDQFMVDKDLSHLINEYEDNCINVDKTVRVILDGQEKIGKAIGITKMGELRFVQASGEEMILNSGEVSVRGLNGYV
ncbi:BirA family biotin operon repressor/biotin-[acetyl-CoA-carboxylase] ligase [Natranaerovirga pectinivora]|uniref:Bifunctional ligase/repressor BirA n=1 Tax=Natranaerovirga pectinivora TaxID=682400 RepID=A0A4R3MLV2_9FIRM|nr:biotin--[acetyl-CoA-carboxylase] ligase [Natranaerovirga pectinivora]TCT14677.1 BirA family biotin operon repressor/biotin-[acetyl-CoA-carboxylase] ligase [Natranaerovirga pectinivora]